MKALATFLVLCCFVVAGFAQTPGVKGSNSDTTFISYLEQKFEISQKHFYHQTLTLKLFLSQANFDGKLKRQDNGISDVKLTFEQALEVIQKIDQLTLGIPKIVYLVGWQYNGHDSKYPAFFEANERLKRKGDANAMQSLRWLMKEAAKYHTTVSVHINMFDAYKDSPLWETYVKNNIVARNADGTLREGEWGWPISYAQEWKTGFTQKRIDSLCKLLPLKDAGTVHIDAFHTWPPIPSHDKDGKFFLDFSKGVTSPYLAFTVADETEAQRNIYRYWASKGVDVTCEGVTFLRESAFDGYQPMAWWFTGYENYLRWPASLYCGGYDRTEWGKLFGTSMHGEDVISKDSEKLSGFAEQFSTRTAVWYYLNRLQRKYIIQNDEIKAVQFSDDVKTQIKNNHYSVMQGSVVLVDNDNVFIPALWLKTKSILAFSKDGYMNRTWRLPKDWANIKEITLFEITTAGKKKIKSVHVKDQTLTLSLARDQMILIESQN